MGVEPMTFQLVVGYVSHILYKNQTGNYKVMGLTPVGVSEKFFLSIST